MDLRWYQKEAVEAAYAYLCSEQGNPVICLPTGSGKSLVIAELARRAVDDFNGRVLILQHRKELIEQNADKVRKLVSIPVGMYSAGLSKRESSQEIVLCGIQSVYDKAHLFDLRNLVIIDEVHLCPNDGLGMYQTFLSDMRAINPRFRTIGLTATPFRTGEGSLVKSDGVFQRICYEAPVKRLIDEGFLCPVTNRTNQVKFDTSGLHKRYGEFIAKEVEALFGGERTASAVREIIQNTTDRNSVMVFCSSVKHAETVVQIISSLLGDDSVAMVEGNTSPLERQAILSRFVDQKIQYLVNVDVLTTGFDAPCVDAIAILRATASAGLFAQIVGRGLRTHPIKKDCLILDFGNNIELHGPIDAIDYGRQKEKKVGKEREQLQPDEKECPACSMVVSFRKQVCECGFRFMFRDVNHDDRPDTVSQIISEPERFEVLGARAGTHRKEGSPDSLRVDYECRKDGESLPFVVSEWVCLLHEGFAQRKARKWWSERTIAPYPEKIEDAVFLHECGAIAIPKSIEVRKEGKFWRILKYEIEEIPEVWSEEVLEEEPF